MDTDFRGAADFWLPEDLLRAIGKVTVAAARLEHGAHLLLRVLWGDPRGQFSNVARDVKRQVRLFAQVLDICDEAVDPVLDWVDRAKATMRERDRLMHSAAFQTLAEEGSAQVGVRIRNGERWDLRVDEVEALACQLRDLAVECMRAVLTFKNAIPEPSRRPAY